MGCEQSKYRRPAPKPASPNINYASIAKEVMKFRDYPSVTCRTLPLPANCAAEPLTYERGCLKLLASGNSQLVGTGYFGLARGLRWNETADLADGRRLSPRQLYVEAIKANPKFSHAFCNLGNQLQIGETVTLADGRTFDARGLYTEAIRHEPTDAVAYSNLGAQLTQSERAVLPDGRSLSKRELYYESMRHSQDYSTAYFNLASDLPQNEVVTLPDGRRMNSKTLYIEAIHLNPKYQRAYQQLAQLLGPNDTVEIDSKTVSKSELIGMGSPRKSAGGTGSSPSLGSKTRYSF